MLPNIFKKKIWLVNRDFQMRYTGAGIIAGLISTIVTTILIIYPLFEFKIIRIGMFLPPPVFLFMLAAGVVNCLLQLMFGIMLTHRVAGPMFAIIRHMRKIGNGHWKVNMRQRPTDDLQMMVRHLNEMSESLVDAASKDLESISKIRTAVADFKGEIGERDFLLAALDRHAQEVGKRIETSQG